MSITFTEMSNILYDLPEYTLWFCRLCQFFSSATNSTLYPLY